MTILNTIYKNVCNDLYFGGWLGTVMLDIGGDLVLRWHVAVEPDEAENDTHCFRDALVKGEGHSFVQGNFDHLDQFALLGFTSSLSDAILFGHLSVEHGLLRSSHSDSWPVGEESTRDSGHSILTWQKEQFENAQTWGHFSFPLQDTAAINYECMN